MNFLKNIVSIIKPSPRQHSLLNKSLRRGLSHVHKELCAVQQTPILAFNKNHLLFSCNTNIVKFGQGQPELGKPNINNISPLKSIIDPRSHGFNIEIRVPVNELEKDITLPTATERELIEPGSAVEKRAARLIVIRRHKMKKHKWKKLQKKMKFVFAKRRQKQEMRKEKAFQAVLINQIKLAEKFDAEQYVADKLEKARWTPPITKVRKILCPEWVIQEHLKMEEEESKLKARIAECLRMKK